MDYYGLLEDIFTFDKGEALPILKPDEFELELEPLRKILLKDEIADLQVAVISIAGAFRTGKSFILNFFLRYFKADGVDDWMGSDDDELNDGFNWQPGPQPHTRGILMWSHPFVIESKGNKIAVILMDTQGNFDHETEKLFNSQIFALSTLISSVQIINIMKQIQKNDLEYLQFFVEFAKFCREKGVEKKSQPFQKLLFVVRDWSHTRDYKHGNEGGKSYLQKECKIGTSKGGSSVREDLHNSFRNIDCFLLPYPGQRVDCPDENFKGSLKDIESLFRDNVRKLVEHVCQSVVPKTYNGKVLTCKTLLEHIKQCYKVMKETNLDLNKTMTELVAEKVNSESRDSCITSFKEKLEKELEQSCGSPDEEFKKRVKLIPEEVAREYDRRAFGSSHCIQYYKKNFLKL